MYTGVLGGLKTGARLGIWTATFVGLQEAIELGVRRTLPRSLEDRNVYSRWASGGLAGLGLATAAGQICTLISERSNPRDREERAAKLMALLRRFILCTDRLSRYSGPRRMFLGASMGLLAGGTHDLRDWMRTKLPDRQV